MRIDEVVQDIAQSPAFQKWFKGSKVINPDGSPKVVYHGTEQEFDEFSKTNDLGFHFGSQTHAKRRLDALRNYARKADRGPSPRAIAVYLRIVNPIVLEEDPVMWNSEHLFKALAPNLGEHIERLKQFDAEQRKQAYLDIEKALAPAQKRADEYGKYLDSLPPGHRDRYYNFNKKFVDRGHETRVSNPIKQRWRSASLGEIKKVLIQAGYDGIIYPNVVESTGPIAKRKSNPDNLSYVAFFPQQIKSIHNANPTESPKMMEARRKVTPPIVPYEAPPPPNPQATAILQRALEMFNDGQKGATYPRDACEGGCDDYADIAAELLEQAGIPHEKLDTDWFEEMYGYHVPAYHVFLKIGNFYYDAQARAGAPGAIYLPFIWRQRHYFDPPYQS